MAGLKPRTKPGIEDFWLALPKFWRQTALDLKMIQNQLDTRNALWKIPPDVVHAHMKSRDSASLALRFDHHTYLPFNAGCCQFSLGSRSSKSCYRHTKIRCADSFFDIYRQKNHFGKGVQLFFFHALKAYFPPLFHRTTSLSVINEWLDEDYEETLKKG
jgi:hypothetical protein